MCVIMRYKPFQELFMKSLKPHSITLSVYNSNLTKYSVCWQTEDFGSPLLQYTDINDVTFENAVTVTGDAEEGMEACRNTAIFNNIVPGNSYLFRVGDESGIFSEPSRCIFPKLDSSKLKFFVVTDTQDEEHHGEWLRYPILDAEKYFSDSELIIHTGDMVQEGGNKEMWRLMLENTKDFFLSRPMAIISGNHDYWEWYLHGHSNILEKHYHIEYPPQDTKNGIYYSFDCGPAHFTMLSSGDSMETNKTGLLPSQLEWLKSDLAKADKPWKIVCIHNPLYSPGKYGTRPPLDSVALALREQLNSVFAEFGVDLVLCGHDHVYAQTYPINASGEPVKNYAFENIEKNGKNYKLALTPGCPIHLESGCSGHQFRGIEPNMPDEKFEYFEVMKSIAWGAVSYSAIEIDGDTLTVCCRRISVNDGSCLDEDCFGIKKS